MGGHWTKMTGVLGVFLGYKFPFRSTFGGFRNLVFLGVFEKLVFFRVTAIQGMSLAKVL